jgi:hypothetical protein
MTRPDRLATDDPLRGADPADIVRKVVDDGVSPIAALWSQGGCHRWACSTRSAAGDAAPVGAQRASTRESFGVTEGT